MVAAVLALNVSNLFDTAYSPCFTAFFNCNNGAPRTVIGTLSYQW
jgi:outer membrane receptor protein involved in Fe transport